MNIADYEPIVGKNIVHELKLLSTKLKKKKIQCINSTKLGGGVAEILSRLIPLLNDLEINATWDVISGDPDYFSITKAFHNALQVKHMPLYGRSEEVKALSSQRTPESRCCGSEIPNPGGSL